VEILARRGRIPRGVRIPAGHAAARTSQPATDAESLLRFMEAGIGAHTDLLLRIAPLIAPFGSLVPQTRVRIRATGSASYGRSIPSYPPEWGGGRTLLDDRDLRDAWPEGVTLPRAIVYNLACTTLGLPAVTSDISVLDRRAAVLLERHVPGYREIIASELPYFVKEAAALVFGRRLAETTPGAACAPPRRCGRTPARGPTWSRRPACSPCSTCATWRRIPRAGTRPRSTRARPPARRN
jgi:phosphoenolpyruvate carboxylase